MVGPATDWKVSDFAFLEPPDTREGVNTSLWKQNRIVNISLRKVQNSK